MRILIIGAGWAGLSAAITATQAGHHAIILEAARSIGGRARAAFTYQNTQLDNGQHILIGAYTETLRMMRMVGIDTAKSLLRLPLTLRYPDGSGLQLPDWPRPWAAGLDVVAGVFQAVGWSWFDKLSLLRAADSWRRSRFQCAASQTVTQLCAGISHRVMQDMIEPLVVSALNTPADRASAPVFLRIMHDALFASSSTVNDDHIADPVAGGNMLLPRTDLGQIFPDAAQRWLAGHGCHIHTGARLKSLSPQPVMLQNKELFAQYPQGLSADLSDKFDAVILACNPQEAARIVRSSLPQSTQRDTWLTRADSLQYEAIATVYAQSHGASLSSPVLALRSNAEQPAQFVFDRSQLTGEAGLLAFVVSASQGDAATLETQVIAQGRAQLGMAQLSPIKTIVEKRATFACTPMLQRPSMRISAPSVPGWWACGDYVEGPYPATLEQAVRSGIAAAQAATHHQT